MFEFIRRLMGYPMKLQEARFETNLKTLEEKNADLDAISLKLRNIQVEANVKRAYVRTLSSGTLKAAKAPDAARDNASGSPGFYRVQLGSKPEPEGQGSI